MPFESAQGPFWLNRTRGDISMVGLRDRLGTSLGNNDGNDEGSLLGYLDGIELGRNDG